MGFFWPPTVKNNMGLLDWFEKHRGITIANKEAKVYRHFTQPLAELIQDQNPDPTVKGLQQCAQRWNAERQADAMKNTKTAFDLSASNVPVRVGDSMT